MFMFIDAPLVVVEKIQCTTTAIVVFVQVPLVIVLYISMHNNTESFVRRSKAGSRSEHVMHNNTNVHVYRSTAGRGSENSMHNNTNSRVGRSTAGSHIVYFNIHQHQ